MFVVREGRIIEVDPFTRQPRQKAKIVSRLTEKCVRCGVMIDKQKEEYYKAHSSKRNRKIYHKKCWEATQI